MSKNLLVIKSSMRGDESLSNSLVDGYVSLWQKENKDGEVAYRNIGENPIPHLNRNTYLGLETKSDKSSTAALKETRELSDKLIEELKAATEIVLGIPMYNFSIPSTLKSYLDHVARSGVTFGYDSSNKSVGLLADKPTLIITTGAGNHADSPRDFQRGYLTHIFNFIGIKNLAFVRAHNYYAVPGNTDDAKKSLEYYAKHKKLPEIRPIPKTVMGSLAPVALFGSKVNYKLLGAAGLFAVGAFACKALVSQTNSPTFK